MKFLLSCVLIVAASSATALASMNSEEVMFERRLIRTEPTSSAFTATHPAPNQTDDEKLDLLSLRKSK